MDKVLTRKLFKDVYLKTINKQVAHFKDGGLASLKKQLEQYAPKGEFLAYINEKEANVLKSLGGSGRIVKETGIPSFETDLSEFGSSVDPKQRDQLLKDIYPVYSEGERQAMVLAPIASALLTGTRQPGQSQLGAVASNVGSAIPSVMTASMQMRKLESERLADIAKLAKTTGQETALQKAMAGLDVKKMESVGDKASLARGELDNIDTIRYLYENPDFKVGAYSGAARGFLEDLARTVGIKGEVQDLAARDLLNNLTGNIALGNLQQLKGSISDKDLAFIRGLNVSDKMSREGAMALLAVREKLAKNAIAYEAKMEDWIDKNGSLRNKDSEGKTWNQATNEFHEQNKVLDDNMKKQLSAYQKGITTKDFGPKTETKTNTNTVGDIVEMNGKRYLRKGPFNYQPLN